MPLLTLKFKDNVLGRYPLGRGDSLTIGRRKDNDIVIDNLAVSGHHARIDGVGDAFILVDLQSKNGTFVNERMVASHRLKHRDVISIGKHQILFSLEQAPAAEEADPLPAVDRTMVMDTPTYRSMVEKSAAAPPRDPAPRLPQGARLAFVSGGKGSLKVSGNLFTLGRDPACDLVVRGWRVGRTAATLSRRPDGWYLSYIGGWSRPRVNGRPLRAPLRLADLDVIALGGVQVQFFVENEADREANGAAADPTALRP